LGRHGRVKLSYTAGRELPGEVLTLGVKLMLYRLMQHLFNLINGANGF
jgi:hypothetical protein